MTTSIEVAAGVPGGDVVVLDDVTLVARAREGDARAYEQLVRRYQGPMYRLAARMLANVGDAEDVVQEVLVLLAACALVAVVAIQMLIGKSPLVDYRSVATTLHGMHWNDSGAALAGGVLALAGLLMLLAAILPGAPTVLPLSGDPIGMDSGATRRSLCSTLRAAASTVDGVNAAKLRLGSRKVAAVVRTNRTNTTGLDDAVRAAVEHRLDQIDLANRPTLTVKVQATRNAL
jgi:hypothetical protein